MLKKLDLTVIFTLLLSLLLTSSALAVPGEMNYQGKITDAAGEPLDGTYSMRFRLYNALTGGNQLWNSPDGEEQTVLVTNGIYDVSLGAIEPLLEKIFSNDNLYLEVAIYNSNSAAWEILTPRQHLTTAAFAFRAADADSLNGFEYSDFATDDHLHDSRYVNEGQANSITSTMIINSSITAVDLADGTALSEILDDDGPGSGLNADYLDNYNSTSFVLTSQDYGRSGVAAHLYEGTTSLTDKYINEAGDVVTGSSTTWLFDFTNSGTGFGIDSSAASYGMRGNASAANGVGIRGNASGASGEGVHGYASGNGGRGVYAYSLNGDGLYAATGASDQHAGSFVSFVGEGMAGAALYVRSWNSTNQGVALWAHNDHTASTDTTAALSNDGTGPLLKGFGGNGGEDEFRFDNDGTLVLYNGDHTLTVKVDPSESGTSDGSQITLYDSDGNSTIELDGDYNGDGRITTEELQVTGGSDLSEQFDIFSNDRIEPGMIVSIDPENPGKLRVAEDAYDKKVAGIVSGAGGIKTGVMMGQRGSEADGAVAVALTGRVYCRADTVNGAIAPGDLLTSSARPGYAMKVSDYQAAQGATIGKAMTALQEGDGLVLVLVTLQ